ncbi:MAG: hypothetical protein WC872_01725 [Candidatus Absconditabacterales bacterium]
MFNPNNEFNEPSNLNGRQLFAKILIGLFIGGIIAALLFVSLSFMGSMFTEALGQQANDFVKPNPLLPLILLFIGFISTFIGNLCVAGIYNLFYNKKYYDSAKMFGLLLLTNGLLFFIMTPLYLLFNSDIKTLFLILGFHVLFAIFISSCQIEFSTNPNYSGSMLIGNVFGFALSLFLYTMIYKNSNTSSLQLQTYLYMLLPSIIGYTLMPFGSGIWEKIYYKLFYELGNNGFYISSPGEISSEQSNEKDNLEEETNVDN